jgi:putative transcriptional regulator
MSMNRSNDKWNVNMSSLQGHFLAANPRQLDPDFIEAVVLVVEHDDRGAMGVIVNCPRDRHERISHQRRAKRWPEEPRLYFGGPVTSPLMAVHTDEAFAGIKILPGVFFEEEEEEHVFTLMQSTERPYKAFTGYTGWGPRQLEHEVECAIWRAIPATAAEIFSSGDDLWERLLREAFDSLLQVMCNVKYIPSDASVN